MVEISLQVEVRLDSLNLNWPAVSHFTFLFMKECSANT